MILWLNQSDAHAWVELWLEWEGWQRVDSTLWVTQLLVCQPQWLLSQGSGLSRR